MRKIAFPSWVVAGSIVENATFICAQWQKLDLPALLGPGVQTKPEIGLCFFEHLACTAYTNEDLPQQLASLPASWHVHLPLDLPFYVDNSLAQAQLSFDICQELMQKVDYLGVQKAVLHPALPRALPSTSLLESLPNLGVKLGSVSTSGLIFGMGPEFYKPQQAEAYFDSSSLLKFIDLWENSGRNRADLLLENQPGDDLFQLFKLAELAGCGLCLDLAHLYMACPKKNLPPTVCLAKNLPCSQNRQSIGGSKIFAWEAGLLNPDFLQKVQMVHINALGQNQSGHASLASLLPEVHEQYQKIISLFPQNSTLMLELFKWQKIEESLPFLKNYLSEGI